MHLASFQIEKVQLCRKAAMLLGGEGISISQTARFDDLCGRQKDVMEPLDGRLGALADGANRMSNAKSWVLLEAKLAETAIEQTRHYLEQVVQDRKYTDFRTMRL
jgi:hypothetical protein